MGIVSVGGRGDVDIIANRTSWSWFWYSRIVRKERWFGLSCDCPSILPSSFDSRVLGE